MKQFVWNPLGPLMYCVLLANTCAAVEFEADVLPVLRKHCWGCHNEREAEAGLILTTMEGLRRGGDSNRNLLMPTDGRSPLLLAVMVDEAEPKMPPEDQPQLSKEEVEVVRRWFATGTNVRDTLSRSSGTIDQQAGLQGLDVPAIPPSLMPKPITDVAVSSDRGLLAVARFQTIDLMTVQQQFVMRLADHPGKVNDIEFSPDGQTLVAATGITGLAGEAWIWDLATGDRLRTLTGHQDTLYAVAIDARGQHLATAGYDREIRLWDLQSGAHLRTLRGHNGPVFDLAFSADGQLLASASADATVKIWRVDSGQRLDTLSQPLKEQFTVAISPDGKLIAAGGADNRIRIWELISRDQPRINPLLLARFAHDRPIQRLAFSADGARLVSVSSDQTLKVWGVETLSQIESVRLGSAAQAFTLYSDGNTALVGQFDGSLRELKLNDHKARREDLDRRLDDALAFDAQSGGSQTFTECSEVEPNNEVREAQRVTLPARVRGTINSTDADEVDVDVFRFYAEAGEAWIFDVQAARNKSLLDSHLRIVDPAGTPVPRVLLHAVRDSYFNFRGKDSDTTGDFRLHNWEEMRLNQLLYASGEVVKLFHYPRGPDSGFNVYPNFGSRHGFFDTTPIAHALHEPCYIVEPHPPGATLPDNGLPNFTIHYENDDESQRRHGVDSLLHFVAPAAGEYCVQLCDVRQMQGDHFHYTLEVRRPKPNFDVQLPKDVKVPAGSGREFMISIDRNDGFNGAVDLTFEDVPDGFIVTGPLIIEQGHFRTWGTLFHTEELDPDAERPPLDTAKIRVFAAARLGGELVQREVGTIGPITLEDAPKCWVNVIGSTGSGVIEVRAGTTTTALIQVTRNGHEGRIGFGKEDALFNSPHGVFVDSTGLNGVLIPPDENERAFTVRAEPWVKSMERPVFVRADVEGTPTSAPVLLRVIGQDMESPKTAQRGVGNNGNDAQ